MGSDHLKRILIVENSKNATGAFHSVLNFYRLLRNDVDLYFAVPKGCWSRVTDISPQNIFYINFLELSKNLTAFWYLPQLIINSIRLLAIVRKNSIEVVHVSDLYNMIGVCLKIFNKDLKVIYHIRLRRTSYAKMLYDVWLALITNFSDQVICVSKVVADDIRISGNSIVIYDCIPLNKLYKGPVTVGKSKYLMLLLVGNYIPGKGQDLALIAFSKALKSIPNLRLRLIGGGLDLPKNREFYRSLQKTAKQLKIEEFVQFGGPSDCVANEMLASDIILNFSESESFSMVCLEALGCRIPVIASNSGGPEEIIRHEVNGLLVTNKDTDQMANAIVRLAGDQELRCRFSLNAQVDFQAKFNPEILAKKLRNEYYN